MAFPPSGLVETGVHFVESDFAIRIVAAGSNLPVKQSRTFLQLNCVERTK